MLATADTTTSVGGIRWRYAWALAAGALLVGSLATGAAMRMTRPGPTTARPVRFVISLPQGFRTTGGGRQELAVSPDGRRIVFVANQRLYLRDLGDVEPHVIRGTDIFTANLGSPVFAPDGSEVAFWVEDDASLKRVPAAGGTPITIAPTLNPLGLHWEPDGLIFAQGPVPNSLAGRAAIAGIDLKSRGVMRIPSGGGSAELLIPIKDDEVATAGASLPGGRGRLYWLKKRADSWDSGTVMVRTPQGDDKVLVRNASDGRYDGAGHLLYAKAGTVLAVPFDLERLAVTGTPVPAIEGVIHPLTSTFSGIAQYSLGVDGTLIYQPGPPQGSDERDAFRLAIFDGKDDVEPLDVPRATYASVRVSPDGSAVAYDDVVNQQGNVWVLPLDLKTAARRLTFDGTRNGSPVWSPDGQWIAFTSTRNSGDAVVFKQRVDGTGVAEPLTKADKGRDLVPMSWSPDGAFLLIASRKEGRYDLLVLSLKDGRLSPFGGATGSTVGTQAAFSPDGRWVVYQRDGVSNSVDLQAFVEPFPATGAKYLVPVKQAGHPFWSRDGRHLYFNQVGGTSVQVDVRTTTTVTFSPARPLSRVGRYEPSPLSQLRNVDALPDGRLLGVVVGDGTVKAEYQVILNWFPAFTAKLAH